MSENGCHERFSFSSGTPFSNLQGKISGSLKKAHKKGKLKFSGDIQLLVEKNEFNKFCSPFYDKKCVVYSKKPFKGAEHVFDYLGRYVQRVAISNNRIVDVKDGKVTFTWKDRNENYKTKEETILADVFISRFLLHEL
jgi:hypothetical protein